MLKQKNLIIAASIIILILGVAYGLFQVSKSRTFQFFAPLIPRVDTQEKIIALTFDDGPTEYTRTVLSILKDKDIKATFFVIGSELKKNPTIGKEIASAGHELGNHTYSHQRMVLKSPSFIATEIESTNLLIRDTGYRGEISFRPPYGKKLLALPWYLSQHNMQTITWDVEPDSYGSSTSFLVDYTLKNTKPGSIILLHPFCTSCTNARSALPIIIDELKKKGYTFVTVAELVS